MCDLCTRKNHDSFEQRSTAINDTLSRYRPSLIALQEVRTVYQLDKLFTGLTQYKLIYTQGMGLSYPDPTIAFDTNQYTLIQNGQFWLGPGEGFSFGWKFALPRQAVWAKLKSKSDAREFIFITAHFDNLMPNLDGSASKVNQFILQQQLPVIFAADTNLPAEYDTYKKLIAGGITNALDAKKELKINSNFPYRSRDLCYTRKGKRFPQCVVEHVLLSPGTDWQVSLWQVDAIKYGKQQRFSSDHRAMIVDLSF